MVNQNMATAVRIHAAERGKDYRRYALFAFGGAGPVHAYELARILKLTRVICPLGAGTNSAFGLLAAPVAVDLSRSYTIPLQEMDWSYLNLLYAGMGREAGKMLADAGIKSPHLLRTADMRFVGQGFELAVEVPAGKLDPTSLRAMKEAFHREYRKVYDDLPGDLPVEAITWRLRASGPQPKVADAVHAAGHGAATAKQRPVYFPERGKFTDTAVLDRYALQSGDVIAGPAVIEERESTLVIGPRGTGTVDTDLNLVVQLSD
jgi:N-methylhydantoinase A